jgi:P27 family predicted phage terminase small subunit
MGLMGSRLTMIIRGGRGAVDVFGALRNLHRWGAADFLKPKISGPKVMGARGRQPDKKMTVLNSVDRRWPNPLPGMTPPARQVWKRIVKAYPYNHFKPQHLDQLRAYCEAAAIHKEARHNLKKSGLLVTQPNGVTKENPYIGIMDKMAGRMQGLAVKLGITKNATINTVKGDQSSETKPKSKREGLLFNG